MGIVEMNESKEPIAFDCDPLSLDRIEAFRKATATQFTKRIPVTFATIFRKAEFAWLDRMKVDMRNLLHTEQEYEYRAPFCEGDRLHVVTKMTEWRERRGMTFVTLETEISSSEEMKVLSRTRFIVRNPGTGA